MAGSESAKARIVFDRVLHVRAIEDSDPATLSWKRFASAGEDLIKENWQVSYDNEMKSIASSGFPVQRP